MTDKRLENIQKINQFLRKAYDPERLSLEEFNLKDYLRSLFDEVRNMFDIKAMVLRYLETEIAVTFEVMATSGMLKEEVEKYKVTLKNRMALELEEKAFKPLKEEEPYLYLKDITKPEVPYDPKELAKKYELNSLIAFPITVRNTYRGFIINYREDKQGFENEDEKKFLGTELCSIIEKIFIFAESFDSITIQYLELNSTLRYEEEIAKLDPSSKKAFRLNYAARDYLRHDILPKAGENFYNAAKIMSEIDDSKIDYDVSKFIVENYLESALAYAKTGEIPKYQNSYEGFKDAFLKGKFYDKIDFYFNKLIRELDNVGLEEQANEVYQDKHKTKNLRYYLCWKLKSVFSSRHRKVSNSLKKSALCETQLSILTVLFKFVGLPVFAIIIFLYWFGHWFWGITSSFGNSFFRWALTSFILLFIYAIIYHLYLPDNRHLSDNQQYSVNKYHKIEKGKKNDFSTSFSFSVTVFTALGFGDIFPVGCLAKFTVASEVMFGYAFLGVFVTLVSRKMIRR